MLRKFDLTIYGHRNQFFIVTAYEPEPDAAFVVHRSYGAKGDWVVTHRGSTAIAARPKHDTRKSALEVAKKLCDACPSATLVALQEDEDGAPIPGSLVGPYEQMRAEILAAVDPASAAA